MPVIVQCVSSILIATVLSTAVNWRMGLVVYAMMPCHVIASLVQVRSAKGFATDISTSHQKLIFLTSEAVSNIRTVASFVQEEEILRKADLALQEPMRIIRMESIKYGAVQGVALCLWHMTHAIQLSCTISLLEKGLATFENCVRSYQTFALTVPSITELWSLIPMVMSTIALLDPALDILDRETQIVPDEPKAPTDEDRITGHIEFADVSFSYPSRTKVTILDGFSLAIVPGQRAAFVGPSGAGKSTVFALLLRFYEPWKGKVLVDSKDIRDYNLKHLRKQIGLVQQEPILFNLSIRENISYGNEGASEAEIVEAAMQANIHEFISGLSIGYDTVVGDKGSQLSGGQKQRIAIARTVLKKPAILLLDEATSALDGASERVVMASLEAKRWSNNGEISGKTTSITIAHRLSTVTNADVIFVMDRGEVVEMGSHETLVSASSGLYSRIYHMQIKGAKV
jgi:ATP-binding cassette subfamily B (MDR/TAP) protein 1